MEQNRESEHLIILVTKCVLALGSPQNCIKCGGRAVYTRTYSGERLCKDCFTSSIVEKTRRTISKYRMLRHGDKVALAVSGGKDSLSMLQILSEICGSHGSKLYAVTVDEGIKDYREEAVSMTESFASSLNVELKVLSFRDLYGYTLDEALEKRNGMKITSCSICGVWRRRAIDVGARLVGANVVATAHNLDDLLQTFLINQFNGDITRLKWIDPGWEGKSEFGLRRIKPFAETYEVEIAFYAFLKDLPFQSVACPHGEEGVRSEIRNFINSMETKHPGVKYSLLKTALDLARSIQVEEKNVQRCQTCGNPSSSNICSVCRTVKLITNKATSE